MSLFHRLRDLAHRAEPEQPAIESPTSPKEESSSDYPAYYYELDDVQKSIFHSPFGPDGYPIDAWTDPYYEAWFHFHRTSETELQRQSQTQRQFEYRPLFSIIVPLYKTPLNYLKTMVDSVLAQTYDNIQLILVNASPELSELTEEVERYRQLDKRIIVVTLERNLGITENTNCGLEIAEGEFCSFLDHDDFIEPDLFYEYVKALNDDPTIDVLYCDEDLVSYDEEGHCFRYLHPMFKPQLSPELLLCKNYIVHLMTVRRSLINSMPRPDTRFDGAQDYNMILYCTNHARRTKGIERILYHWRISNQSTAANPEAKPYSRQAYKLSAHNQLKRNKIDGSIVASGLINIHNIWMNKPRTSVVLIVDFPHNNKSVSEFLEVLQQNGVDCVSEVILVTDSKIDTHLHSIDPHSSISIICCTTTEKNKIARLSFGASHAHADTICFLDASCSAISADSFHQLSALCGLTGVGIASPKILYRDGTTKSFGVAVTSRRIMPLHRGYPDDFPAYQCNARAFQNMSACALQGLCINRKLFQELGGFDERFEGEIAAVDLCKRVLNHGLRIVVTPTVKIEINEPSPSNPYDFETQAPDYSLRDLDAFDEKWHGARATGDPYFNSNLDQSSPYFQLSRP